MTYPVECFFLAAFESRTEGQRFIESKPDTSEKTERIKKETEMLKESAVAALEKMSTPMSTFFLEQILSNK